MCVFIVYVYNTSYSPCIQAIDKQATYIYNVYMFEWDEKKNKTNTEKHGVSFEDASQAFYDPCRLITCDRGHSQIEDRYFCVGKISGGIVTVRFALRGGTIRIIGAGFWRDGRNEYEQRNKIH